ncbi:hypothetical protein A5320_01025 [Rheinheimera sp. SA_1]|uniref:hypothetical protein n=1 Tax=Rheinheimera sp. SA_1 TaxID=1827365 RepID=UPI0007FD887A|nr:hypothetical protein [Rheinheimera sp. SA_1]OBP16043.1 hypothetical protein A5320_01025 [Rheinheimera sp. SA_1]
MLTADYATSQTGSSLYFASYAEFEHVTAKKAEHDNTESLGKIATLKSKIRQLDKVTDTEYSGHFIICHSNSLAIRVRGKSSVSTYPTQGAMFFVSSSYRKDKNSDYISELSNVSAQRTIEKSEDKDYKDMFEKIYDKAVYDKKSAASILMHAIEHKISKFDINAVDSILRKIDFDKAGEISAISVIKSTKRCNSGLKFWALAKYNAESTLRKLGYDPVQIFKGI